MSRRLLASSGAFSRCSQVSLVPQAVVPCVHLRLGRVESMTCLCGHPYDFYPSYSITLPGITYCGGCGAAYFHSAIFVWRDDE